MGLSNRQIAKKLHRAPQTINNEIKRGWIKTIKQVQKKANGKEYRYYTEQYYAETGQAHLKNRLYRRRGLKSARGCGHIS